MASSRWKRFAFFERHTLTIDPEISEDLLPTGGTSLATTAVLKRSLRSLQQASNLSNHDAVSMVSTAASLPLWGKKKNHTGDGQQQQQEVEDESMQAMWSSLNACTPETMAAATMVDTTIQLPSQGKESLTHPPQASKKPSSLQQPPGTVLDGLVLTFLSSRYTDLIHCIDVTARCQPGESDNNKKKLEDLDGWRGYFAPFSSLTQAKGSTTNTSASSSSPPTPMEQPPPTTTTADDPPKIVAMAVCRALHAHHPVLLACATATNICVWEDPHWHLSCRKPLQSSATSSNATNAVIYTLQSTWNRRDGTIVSMDMGPSLVAVGTTSGFCIVFAYSQARRTLKSYLRIPPPSGDAVAASAVRLSLGGDSKKNSNKASVFVSYRQNGHASTTEESTTTTTTNAAAAASNEQQQQQQQSNQAGICCYELPIPSSSSAITAPSARHDLDGRSVETENLVDSFVTPAGLRFTVVRNNSNGKEVVYTLNLCAAAYCLLAPERQRPHLYCFFL